MLEPDRDQLEIFVDACFRHAGDKGFVAVRSFFEGNDKTFRQSISGLSGGLRYLIDVAEDDARRAAQNPTPVVFCPPIAVFANRDHAREEDILLGLALSVECDQHPNEARTTLEGLLGLATVVVRSGGTWINGGTTAEDKLHLHWRLKAAAGGRWDPKTRRHDGDLGKLKTARELAAELVGGDTSNVPVCHCIRWPGSWHRKGEARLCSIEQANPDVEIELEAALAVLQAAAPPKPEAKASGAGAANANPQDWDDLVADIINGRAYHRRLVELSAKLVGAGLYDGQAVKLLRSIMQAVVAPHDPARWQVRYDEIPRVVSSAREKYAAANAPPTPGLTIVSAGVATTPPPRGWLLGNSFCRRLTSSLLAAGATGKTALRILQAMALATGRPLTGEHVFQRTRVLLVSLEDDLDELQRRVLAARLHHNISAAELDGWLFLTAPGSSAGKLMTANRKTGTITVGPLAGNVEAAIVEHKIGLVILDPLVKAHGLTENSNDEMDQLGGLLTGLAAKHDIAVDLPHHVGKGAADPGNADRGRGASSTINACRLVYSLSSMTLEEAQRFGIAEDDRRGYVRLDRAKLNVARSHGPATWFRLVGVPIGNATTAYPAGDDVQTVETWSPPETWGGLDVALLNQILSVIALGPGNGNFYTAAGAATDRAAWEVVRHYAPQKTETQAREIINTWVKTGLLVKFDYDSPTTRKRVTGLKVDNDKRPS